MAVPPDALDNNNFTTSTVLLDLSLSNVPVPAHKSNPSNFNLRRSSLTFPVRARGFDILDKLFFFFF